MVGGWDSRGWVRFFQIVLFFFSIYAASSPKNHIDSKFYSKEYHGNTGAAKHHTYSYLLNFEVLGPPLEIRPRSREPVREKPKIRALREKGEQHNDIFQYFLANSSKCTIVTYQVIILIVKCAGDIESNPGPTHCYETNNNHELNSSYHVNNTFTTGGSAHYNKGEGAEDELSIQNSSEININRNCKFNVNMKYNCSESEKFNMCNMTTEVKVNPITRVDNSLPRTIVANKCEYCKRKFCRRSNIQYCYNCSRKFHAKCYKSVNIVNQRCVICNFTELPFCNPTDDENKTILPPVSHPNCKYCTKQIKAKNKSHNCKQCLNKFHPGCYKAVNINDIMCTMCLLYEMPFAECDISEIFDCTRSIKNNIIRPSKISEDKFKCFKSKGLHFIHVNARSMFHKLSEIKLVTNKCNPAILAITESWLDESFTNESIGIEGYNKTSN